MGSPKRLVPLSVLVALCLALTLGCGATTPIGTVEKDMEEKAALEPEVQQEKNRSEETDSLKFEKSYHTSVKQQKERAASA